MEDHHRKVTLLMSHHRRPQAAQPSNTPRYSADPGRSKSAPRPQQATSTRHAVHEQIRFDGIGKSGFELLVAAGEIENRQLAVEREAQLVFQAALHRGRDAASCGS
jgi:hypothetical protein